MKIKKTYMPYKVGLFVGLLSFNTLSSCVKTSRQLSMYHQSEEQKNPLLEILSSVEINDPERPKTGAQLAEQMERYYKESNPEHSCWNWKKTFLSGAMCGTALGMLALISTVGYHLYNNLYNISCASNDTYSTATNETAVLGNPMAPFIPVVSQEVRNISNTTTAYLASTGANLGIVATTTLPSLGILGAILKTGRSSSTNALNQDLIDAVELSDFDLNELKYLFQEGSLSVNARYQNGQTLLMRAADLSLPEVVEFLVKKGADVHLKDDLGNTAMMYAHFTNSSGKKIAELLLEYGVDPCQKNNRGQSPSWKARPQSSSGKLLQKLKRCNESSLPAHSL